jgi:hypothetical protein
LGSAIFPDFRPKLFPNTVRSQAHPKSASLFSEKKTHPKHIPTLSHGASPQEGLEDKKFIYAYSNFLRGWLSHLIKKDRLDKYYNSPANGNGRSINVGMISAKYMNRVGVEALGAYDSTGHEYILRMRLAVPIIHNMLIANGPIDAPISGSKMIVYGDDYLPCPLEVHWMVIDPSFDRNCSSAV